MRDILIKVAYIYGFTKNSRAFYDLTVIDSFFKISFIRFSSPTNHIAFTICETKLKFRYSKRMLGVHGYCYSACSNLSSAISAIK